MQNINRHSNRIACFFSILLMLTLIPLSTGSNVFARPFRLSKMPNGGKNFSCATCHINPRGGGDRNTFGKDYQKAGIPAGDKYTPALGKMDSDGDGFTNDQEFSGGTNPGDPASKP